MTPRTQFPDNMMLSDLQGLPLVRVHERQSTGNSTLSPGMSRNTNFESAKNVEISKRTSFMNRHRSINTPQSNFEGATD